MSSLLDQGKGKELLWCSIRSVVYVQGNDAMPTHVPGRKTDVIDTGWIAEILYYWLLRPSFVPPGCFGAAGSDALPERR